MNEMQISLLEKEESDNTIASLKSDSKLEVAKVCFEEGQRISWKELFSGFDTLYAITYSSGINFVSKLLKLFDKSEIIFGCEQVIYYSLQEVMAYQTMLIERIRSTKSKDFLMIGLQYKCNT